ncbi:hypothetical protein SAMN05216389_10728 [Oceanobacillus limi]|uniref:Uncharacterized protein n=1 Tax=Oceanobacillus limi TaxID=930131 RepID=A0A1I0CQE9_9BACI|nr:hypothetical protein SAMN05216389_10728 [Oceanobacillus limi]
MKKELKIHVFISIIVLLFFCTLSIFTGNGDFYGGACLWCLWLTSLPISILEGKKVVNTGRTFYEECSECGKILINWL